MKYESILQHGEITSLFILKVVQRTGLNCIDVNSKRLGEHGELLQQNTVLSCSCNHKHIAILLLQHLPCLRQNLDTTTNHWKKRNASAVGIVLCLEKKKEEDKKYDNDAYADVFRADSKKK